LKQRTHTLDCSPVWHVRQRYATAPAIQTRVHGDVGADARREARNAACPPAWSPAMMGSHLDWRTPTAEVGMGMGWGWGWGGDGVGRAGKSRRGRDFARGATDVDEIDR
jgi:hypothetical protein